MYNMDECKRNNIELNKPNKIDNTTVWFIYIKLNQQN